MKRATVERMSDVEHDSEWDYTIEDYVRLEELSELVKHEFDNGDIRAMSGGTLEHARLATAVMIQLGVQLRGKPCVVLSSDSRVHVDSANVITYPDVSIVCGPSVMSKQDVLAQTNPTVVVEVTSKSSERYDRGRKREHYQKLASLREYVIVSQFGRSIDVYTRAPDGSWPAPMQYGAGERARLHSIDCDLDIDELYTDPRTITH